jgi:phosphatidylglycerol:prolipoprotein diacylglycerol transferase
MNSYFIWDGSPIMLDLGTIPLPFEIKIPGLILALLLYFGGRYFIENLLKNRTPGKRKRRSKETEVSFLNGYQKLGLAIAAFVIGQLLFMASSIQGITELGPIAFRWYGLMFAASFMIGYYIGSKTFEHAGKPPEYADVMFMYLIVATVLGARLGHVFFYDFDYYIRNIHEIFYFWQGGLASHGAVIGVLTALWLFSRKYPDCSFLWLADRIALPFALGGMFVRIGNFYNSEILGRATDVPWAVVFTSEDMIARHPSMLYESLLCLFLFVLLVGLYKHFKNSPPEGSLTAVFMIVLFVGRFLIEYTKERQPGFDETLTFLSMGQILSIPFVLVGFWLFMSKVDWKKTT